MTHAAYVTAAYMLSVLAICGLAAWILADQAAMRRALRELEERGIRRRSNSREAQR
ncbi:heme exporter protein CcmD [Chelativorans sp. Marseille-P2723]|uniref:heme exporter protein CcmD n=1 Tax=Chelativorans sp. Marseille-P2723 TaxID=2709133 RepID=UPI0015708159|nr:heme exporter protein CcmD [Chelativorans sp. Marseille-P2723]